MRKSTVKAMQTLLLLCAVSLTGGCAVGAKYNYVAEDVGLPLKANDGTGVIGVGTEDARPYILNGDKPATFVGLQRGGFGNPFDVNTQSKQPFSDDAAKVLANLMQKSEFSTTLKSSFDTSDEFLKALQASDAQKGVYLLIREWKTDIYASINLQYDLELRVYGRDGQLLAKSQEQGNEPLGAAKISQSSNSTSASVALSTKISYLFNDAAVKEALK